MKKITKLFMAFVMLLGFCSFVVNAEEENSITGQTETTTHEVEITATHDGKALSQIRIMLSQNGETITYATTNKWGKVKFDLEDGTYLAMVGYSSGNYSYFGDLEFTINGTDEIFNLAVDRTFSQSATDEVYDETDYYDHVDIRVAGSLTSVTGGASTTSTIRIANVSLIVTDGNATIINKTFTDLTENYEWRVTRVKVPKTAKVQLIYDIMIDGKIVRENLTATFQGESDFKQAIVNCDMHQGLDFIINAREIIEEIEDVLYKVDYEWIVYDLNGNPVNVDDLPNSLKTPPTTTGDYAKGSSHSIDTEYQENRYVIDEENGVAYIFYGWDSYSNDEKTNESIGNSTSITIDSDTTIKGEWRAYNLDDTQYHFVLKKSFNNAIDIDKLPSNLYFTITSPNGNTEVIPYSDFQNGSYSFPVYEEGDYIISEYNTKVNGYDFKGATITTDNAIVTQSSTSITITVSLPVSITDINVAEVSFLNTYEKRIGKAIHQSHISIEKADAKDSAALEGAVFTLTNENDGNDKVVSEPTNESGYTSFDGISEGSYILTETTTPKGYINDGSKYRLVLELPDNYVPSIIYDTVQDAYVEYYTGFVMTVYDYDSINDQFILSNHYSEDSSRLFVYNEKIKGSLTISKDFGTKSDIKEEDLAKDKEIKVTVTGENDFKKTVILNKDNSYTVTLDDLELGTYKVTEEDAEINGYKLTTDYSDGINIFEDEIEVTLSETATTKEVTVTNTYTSIKDNNGIPKTSDSSNLIVYLMITLCGFIGLIISIIKYNKTLYN